MGLFNIPDPLWESTLYFWVWELLATIFILTNFYMIWRITVLSDKVDSLRPTKNEET